MYEIEVKILDINREEVERRLLSLGAKKVFDGEVHALYFDSADHSIRDKKDTLRLRRTGEKTALTFKKHVENPDFKVREEKEVEVSDFGIMQSMLESMGFSVWLEMKKNRTTYAIEGLHFEFDKYHGQYEFIPEFLEIEAADAEQIYKYVELLGLMKEDCKPWDALQVAEYYAAAG